MRRYVLVLLLRLKTFFAFQVQFEAAQIKIALMTKRATHVFQGGWLQTFTRSP